MRTIKAQWDGEAWVECIPPGGRQMGKGERINRMMAWLENKIDKALEQPHETDEAETTRKMSVLTHLYQLQQSSVRMARQQKLMDDVRAEKPD